MEEKRKLTRRDFLRLGGVGASVVALASCAPQAAEPVADEPVEEPVVEEPAAEPVTIEFLAWGDNADIPAWDELAKKYTEMNPNVTVNVTAVADPGNNFYPKLQTMVAGGTPPVVSSFQG